MANISLIEVGVTVLSRIFIKNGVLETGQASCRPIEEIFQRSEDFGTRQEEGPFTSRSIVPFSV